MGCLHSRPQPVEQVLLLAEDSVVQEVHQENKYK
jgi:hypothetical protein